MGPTERHAAIQALGNFFAPLSEPEADKILVAVQSPLILPHGWGRKAYLEKVSSIKRMLADLPDDALSDLLMEFLPESKRLTITTEATLKSTHIAETRTSDGPIFVVHGRALAALYEAVRVLERATGREVIILREQANAGRTLLEKFEDHATSASFAVILLTGDDQGGIREGSEMHRRGRQNVIFELGFFFGKLGRKRVAVLLEDNVERPSDVHGLVYIDFDQAGAWKQLLARELEAAGIPIDRSRIP